VDAEDEASLLALCGCFDGEKGEGVRFRFDVFDRDGRNSVSETTEGMFDVGSLAGSMGIMGRAKTVTFSSL
jgi:hypothetical protein